MTVNNKILLKVRELKNIKFLIKYYENIKVKDFHKTLNKRYDSLLTKYNKRFVIQNIQAFNNF